MQHIELRLNTLKRPKLMLEAARNGLASYDPSAPHPISYCHIGRIQQS